MWMACFWDPMRNDYHQDQMWHDTWSPGHIKTATFCKEGLEQMIAYKLTARRCAAADTAASTASSASCDHHTTTSTLADHMEDLRLGFMHAWCRRVAENTMPHGPLLAHAVQCGHMLVEHSTTDGNGQTCSFLVPTARHGTWNDYDWSTHGEDGLAAIKQLLLVNHFWPAPIMPVSHLPCVTRMRSQKEDNLSLLADCAPCLGTHFSPLRGVKVFVQENVYREQYSWVRRAGMPSDVEQSLLRPASFSYSSVPGAATVSYYMQSKGHYFYAFYRHEGTGHLVAKWVRGRTEPGKKQWQVGYAADIDVGVGHINGWRFINGVYLVDGDQEFPIFLYMERPPQKGQHPEQLHLLACCEVPAAVQHSVQPSSWQPRKGQSGWVVDPGRGQWMHQQAQNGAIQFGIAGTKVFHQDREQSCLHSGVVGVPKYAGNGCLVGGGGMMSQTRQLPRRARVDRFYGGMANWRMPTACITCGRTWAPWALRATRTTRIPGRTCRRFGPSSCPTRY